MRAVVITQGEPSPSVSIEDLEPSLLGGDTLIAVEHSCINFKDAMVTQPGNRVARRSPVIGGVDLAGRVLEAPAGTFKPGTSVVVHGRGLGVSQHGGFAPLARVPHEWVTPLPDGLSTRSAMLAGTAGFTAVASLAKLEAVGISPGRGPILVTGASGGVGSIAILALASAGYEVVASTGKVAETKYLKTLGASQVIRRDAIDDRPERSLGSERWAGAIDCVGGSTLTAILRSLSYDGAVAASGLTGGSKLETSVYPFIVRGVSLLGIDSVEMPNDERRQVWGRLTRLLSPKALESILDGEVGLDGVPEKLVQVAAGQLRGRVLVTPESEPG
jgi:acrylyl-CoA reductase (NADPH)